MKIERGDGYFEVPAYAAALFLLVCVAAIIGALYLDHRSKPAPAPTPPAGKVLPEALPVARGPDGIVYRWTDPVDGAVCRMYRRDISCVYPGVKP